MAALLNLGLCLLPGIGNWGCLGGLQYGTGLAWFIGPTLEVVRSETPPRIYLVDRRSLRQARLAVLAGSFTIPLMVSLVILKLING